MVYVTKNKEIADARTRVRILAGYFDQEIAFCQHKKPSDIKRKKRARPNNIARVYPLNKCIGIHRDTGSNGIKISKNPIVTTKGVVIIVNKAFLNRNEVKKAVE